MASQSTLIALAFASILSCAPPPGAPAGSDQPASPDDYSDGGAAPTANPDLGSNGPAPSLPDMATGASPDLASTPPAPPAPPAQSGAPAHRRCGWIGPGDTTGVRTFVAHADWFDAIHPDWYALASDSVSVRTLADADDGNVVAAAAANHVALSPLVAAVDNDAALRAMLYDPAKRAAHVKVLTDLAVKKGYAGIDIDYEHLWTAADRAPYTAFMTELAAALHAVGKQLTLCAPGMDHDATDTAWSYKALSTIVDHVHVMGYDFHSISTHAGPTAPLGWIDSVAAYAESTGHPDRFVLGLPNYGVGAGFFCALGQCAASCTSAIADTTNHMQTCPFGNYAAGRSLNCSSAAGQIYFDDAASLEQKVEAAQAHSLGGITYWTVGSEPAGFFDMVKKHY